MVFNKLGVVVAPLGPPKPWKDWEEGPFDLHYGFRNPTSNGQGLGMMGIDKPILIERYKNALKQVYTKLTSKGWKVPAGRIRVYVFDTTRYWHNRRDAPFAFPDHAGPVIGLRSNFNEPTEEAMLDRAEVEAAHEVTHTFNHVLHPPDMYAAENDPPWRGDSWKWFDEATAVFMEREVFATHAENLRFARDWAYRPELELEEHRGAGGYCASWFVEYLVKTFGWEFLHAVWHDKRDPRERPVHVIGRLLLSKFSRNRPGPEGEQRTCDEMFAEMFAGQGRADEDERKRRYADKQAARQKGKSAPGCCCNANPGDFCDDNYVTRSYSVHCFAREVHKRFGSRSVAQRLDVPSRGLVGFCASEPIGPLSCRYYQLYPEQHGRSVRVRLTVNVPPTECHLRGALMPVIGTHQHGATIHLTRLSPPDAEPPTVFEGRANVPHGGGDGHLVLAVSNVYIVPVRCEPAKTDWQTFELTGTGSPEPVPEAAIPVHHNPTSSGAE
jgi:hypothetical protein